ncbi:MULTISPECIES: MIP/aquaporin family protein [unclassified Mycoplasma]|uniref:MIP/aquaporin family protein n=1 Tax=unclassified Mycoplasma TaxID=2683645 RepID=UPI00211C82F2|nr:MULTISPECIES: MIP/aquaporin family protein [unclassified Mycoplasma]UUM19595.1 aquaporin family protein [Mycoplasma sp. 1578d]UUM24515.1 aquaporin family protein [Mycoplasma sp. 3686d]
MDVQFGAGFVSELIGTMFLILLGNGVCASLNYPKMYAKNVGGNWVAIIMGWGLAVLVGVVVSSALFKAMTPENINPLLGAAHLNPAVTIAVFLKSGSQITGSHFGLAIVYIIAQLLGAALGQTILNFINYKHIIENPSGLLKDSSCTGSTHRESWLHSMSYEIVGTVVLLSVVFGAGSLAKMEGGWIVSLAVMGIGLSLGSVTGYAINPARDLAPRFVYYVTTKLLAKKMSGEIVSPDFKYGLLVPVLSPILGAIFVGAIASAF